MNVLELFSGTHSVGKCCNVIGWNPISVDLELPATHECDVMGFDYKQYPQDYFSVVWASPPCTYYSSLQNCWIGRKKKDGILVTRELIEEKRKESDKLILKTLEIIDYFKPEIWFMENPQRGQLKDRDVVKGLPYYDVSYCMYSDWGYEKRTRIWTNKKDWTNLICDKSGACGNMIEIPTDGAVRHDTGKPLKCANRKLHTTNCGKSETLRALKKVRHLHQNNCGNTEKLQAVRQHKKALGNGYEMIDGKKVICNTKELRKKHKLNVAKDVHTIGTTRNKHEGTTKLDRYRIPSDLIYSLLLD